MLNFNSFKRSSKLHRRPLIAARVYPSVTAEEIRDHLKLRYDFNHAIPLEEAAADVERYAAAAGRCMITHPRYFGLFNPSVTLASVVADNLRCNL